MECRIGCAGLFVSRGTPDANQRPEAVTLLGQIALNVLKKVSPVFCHTDLVTAITQIL